MAIAIHTSGHSPAPTGSPFPAALTFREELSRLLTFLGEEHGFAVVDETLALNRGGDCSVTLQSPEFRLRFVRDKAHLFADVGANSSAAWYELNTALEYLNGVRPLAGSFDVIGLQAALASNFGALRDLFGRVGFATRANSLERFTAMTAAARWSRLRDAGLE
jgi:hypothetical protein